MKRGKNDRADAEAICEAMSRPTMRFVAVKTAEEQAALMLAGLRDQMVRRRTQLTNAIRGYAGEFGLACGQGADQDRGRCWSALRRTRSSGAGQGHTSAAYGQEYAELEIEGGSPRSRPA